MAFVVFGKIIVLSQLVYWLESIKAPHLYLLTRSYLATILHWALILGSHYMFNSTNSFVLICYWPRINLVTLRFHAVFLMNARKWESLTDFSRIDRTYDPNVNKRKVILATKAIK